ncbi:MAG: DUF2490 domain-containing protein [Chitinophagaceae bacterium]|nr:DUF2490 domain-containing protein [Chitinophagaceae bacterium]
MKFLAGFVFFLLMVCSGFGQNDRVNDYNFIAWTQSVNTFTLSKKVSYHAEYNWRRVSGFRHWMQSLLRTGFNYNVADGLQIHAGYAWIVNFPYGDYPAFTSGTLSEHRLYEQLQLRQTVKQLQFSHRFRIEQRWLERKNSSGRSWVFMHRFRYQFRTLYPLWKKNDKQAYVAAADELFIGAGRNLGINIFDQNRLFFLLGYRFSKHFALEAGYMNHTLQQARRINGNTIMQRNNGIFIGTHFQK